MSRNSPAAAALAIAAAFAHAGCDAGGIDPAELAVDERGPFSVGFRAYELAYTTRTGASRTIEIDLWYPTEETTGYNPAYHDLFRDDDAFEDAAIAPPIHDGGYPVHVYSHGFQGFAGTSSDLMGYFASHGWIAVAPGHTDNQLFDPEPLPPSHYSDRADDVSAALDFVATLEELPAPARTEAVLLSGHSFGTFTTWATAGAAFDEAAVREGCADTERLTSECSEQEIQALMGGLGDERVVAGMPMAGGDGGWWGEDGFAAVDVPMFLMTGGEDDVGAQALFDTVTGVDLTWIEVAGGCHQLFGLGGCFEIDDATGFTIVNTYALAFARRFVLGEETQPIAGIVDGSVPVSELVTYRAKHE